MIDQAMVGVTFKEPTHWTGRWTGTAANVPTKVTATSQKTTIARSGVGQLTVTLSDPGGPVGVVQVYDFWVNTSLIGGANYKQVLTTPVSANSGTFTLQVQFANGTAVDLTANDELNMDVWTSRSSNP